MTSVTFWLELIAERSAFLACVRKPRSEFLGTAIVLLCLEKQALLLDAGGKIAADDVSWNHCHVQGPVSPQNEYVVARPPCVVENDPEGKPLVLCEHVSVCKTVLAAA